jgi:transcriptional antiterminator RfaH
MDKWCLLYTKPHQEKIALTNLENQGYTAYLPLVDVEKIVRGARKVVRKSLFPRYLFLSLDPNGTTSWLPIRSTLGVANLVRFGSALAQVSPELVDSIRRAAAGAVITREHQPGERLAITSGPFRGLEAIFQTYDGERRAVLLLTILGKSVRATQELAQIKKA